MEKSTAYREATGLNRLALDLQQETGLPYQQCLHKVLPDIDGDEIDLFADLLEYDPDEEKC